MQEEREGYDGEERRHEQDRRNSDGCTPTAVCPEVIVLGTKMTIGIALLSTIVALLGIQTVYQIPQLKEYTNAKFEASNATINLLTARIVVMEKADGDMKSSLDSMQSDAFELREILRSFGKHVKTSAPTDSKAPLARWIMGKPIADMRSH